MECNYIWNFFSNFYVVVFSEDVVYCRFVNDENFVNDGKVYGWIFNGYGILIIVDGKFLYSGEWCKGKFKF